MFIGHEVQAKVNGTWVTVRKCKRSSMTFAAICATQAKHPGADVRVVSYNDVVGAEYIGKQKS